MADNMFRAEPLAKHGRGSFSCGDESLDCYFHQQATQDLRRNLAAVYVLVDTTNGLIAGFYTLSSFTLVPSSLPESEAKKVGCYPSIPTILVGRLARDLRYGGKGVGELLMIDALRRAQELSQQLGAWAVVVDAKNDAARKFYEGFGFLRLTDDQYRLFLPMKTVEKMLAAPTETPTI